MTAYFDELNYRLSCVHMGSNVGVRELEEQLVFDVSVCIAFDEFPADLRERANKSMLEHAVYQRPANAGSNPRAQDHESDVEEVRAMSAALQMVFHEYCARDPANHSDEPRAPLRALFAKSEAAREALWAAERLEAP